LNKDRTEVPRLDLPVDVLIVRHPKEKRSKSSVIPSGIISPDNVQILHTVDIPDQRKEFGDDPDAVVLMFPSDEAVEVAKMSKEELLKIKKVILIDCTWSQTRHYLKQDYI
jgi:DTW domain-containing protein YfiP